MPPVHVRMGRFVVEVLEALPPEDTLAIVVIVSQRVVCLCLDCWHYDVSDLPRSTEL